MELLDMNTLVETTTTTTNSLESAPLEHDIPPNRRSPENSFYRFGGDGVARNLFGSPPPPVLVRTSSASRSDQISHTRILGNNNGGRNLNGSPSMMVGLQNTSSPGQRTTNASLPSYYPTTPHEEIQRRINRFRPTYQESNILQVNTDHPDAPHEHNISLASIQIYTDDEFDDIIMAPQEKLLNAIDILEKVFMRELHWMQSTSSFREAQRKRKVCLVVPTILSAT